MGVRGALSGNGLAEGELRPDVRQVDVPAGIHDAQTVVCGRELVGGDEPVPVHREVPHVPVLLRFGQGQVVPRENDVDPESRVLSAGEDVYPHGQRELGGEDRLFDHRVAEQVGVLVAGRRVPVQDGGGAGEDLDLEAGTGDAVAVRGQDAVVAARGLARTVGLADASVGAGLGDALGVDPEDLTVGALAAVRRVQHAVRAGLPSVAVGVAGVAIGATVVVVDVAIGVAVGRAVGVGVAVVVVVTTRVGLGRVSSVAGGFLVRVRAAPHGGSEDEGKAKDQEIAGRRVHGSLLSRVVAAIFSQPFGNEWNA